MKLQDKLNKEAQKTTGRRESEQKETGGVFAMVYKTRVWTFVNMLKKIFKIKIPHPPHINVEIWATLQQVLQLHNILCSCTYTVSIT